MAPRFLAMPAGSGSACRPNASGG